MLLTIISVVIALLLGGACGYLLFLKVVNGKYKQTLADAEREANVIKEKKLLEVKEKFLNKKAELEKEVQQRNQRIAQAENKLRQREMTLNQRQEEQQRRKQSLDDSERRVEQQRQGLQRREEELQQMQLREREKLRRTAANAVARARKA